MFKIGDKVRIIHNNVGMLFGNNKAMNQYVGRITTIKSYIGMVIRLEIDNGHWSWDERSLEHVNTLHVGDVVRSKDHNKRTLKIIKCFNNDNVDPHYKGVDVDGYFVNFRAEQVNIAKKYQLRNSKGHFMPCDRDVIPKPVKAVKAVNKVGDAAIIKKRAVAPIKPLPAPPKAMDIRSELSTKARAGYDGNRCNYSIEFDNGKIRHQAPDACHARLCWSDYYREDSGAKAIVNIALNITPHYKELTKENKEIYPKFVNYMLNESPWAFCFVTKDVKEALEVGILMDVNQNVSHIVGAAMSLRLATEFPATLKPFGDALDKGYSGNVAHLISGHLMGGKVTNWPTHSALISSLNKGAIIKFFKTGYPNKLPAIAKDRKQTRYDIFNTISPGAGYGGENVGDGESLSEFVAKQAVSTKRGEGFNAKTIFDYEATLIKMADAFTKELA